MTPSHCYRPLLAGIDLLVAKQFSDPQCNSSGDGIHYSQRYHPRSLCKLGWDSPRHPLCQGAQAKLLRIVFEIKIDFEALELTNIDHSGLQLGVDYYLPHLTLKTLVGLTAAPTVNVAATTGWNDLVLGGTATFDVAKNNNLTAWTAGVGVS